MKTDKEEKWLCHKCVGESFLKGKIKRVGETQKCSFCGRRLKAIPLEDVANEFEHVFNQYLDRTSDQQSEFDYLMARDGNFTWERPGDPVLDVLQEIGEIDEPIAEELRSILNDRYGSYSYDDPEESEFDEDSHYSYRSVNTQDLSEAWKAFEDNLKTGSRYFSRTAEEILAGLFAGIHDYAAQDGQPVIVEAGPGTTYTSLYRARVFQNDDALEQAIKRPDREIGPPPFKLAAAGRMNARGISVFYGAVDRKVALAEVRPFVGSRVATAKFDLIRPLRLLDIEALKSVTVKGSLFDPSHAARLEKAEFLASLSRRMTKPVMPDDEPFEYLSTQAIADFLATALNPTLDGIIYPSVQAAEGMRNVVLFHKAARVQEMVFPEGTKISAHLETNTADGPEADYWVWEETPKKNVPPADQKNDSDGLLPWNFQSDFVESREPALKIVEASVEVHHITGISFGTEDFSVRRHRSEKTDYKFLKIRQG